MTSSSTWLANAGKKARYTEQHLNDSNQASNILCLLQSQTDLLEVFIGTLYRKDKSRILILDEVRECQHSSSRG